MNEFNDPLVAYQTPEAARVAEAWVRDQERRNAELQSVRNELVIAQEQIESLELALTIARENARTQLGMTLRKFAALCGHSPTQISKWTGTTPSGQPDFVRRSECESP